MDGAMAFLDTLARVVLLMGAGVVVTLAVGWWFDLWIEDAPAPWCDDDDRW